MKNLPVFELRSISTRIDRLMQVVALGWVQTASAPSARQQETLNWISRRKWVDGLNVLFSVT